MAVLKSKKVRSSKSAKDTNARGKRKLDFDAGPGGEGPYLRARASDKALMTNIGEIGNADEIYLHVDWNDTETGVVEGGRGGMRMVSHDREDVDGRDRRWGAAVRVAVPYPLEIDGETYGTGVPPSLAWVTSRPWFESIGDAHSAWVEAVADDEVSENDVAVYQVTGFLRAGTSYWRPELELVGSVPAIADIFNPDADAEEGDPQGTDDGSIPDDDDDA